MKWILIFLCLPAFGQLPVLPFAPSPVSSTVSPAAFMTGLAEYWEFTSLTTNATVTNWIGQLQGTILTNGNASLRPTNSASGVGFAGTQSLTNTIFTVGSNWTAAIFYQYTANQLGSFPGTLYGSNNVSANHVNFVMALQSGGSGKQNPYYCRGSDGTLIDSDGNALIIPQVSDLITTVSNNANGGNGTIIFWTNSVINTMNRTAGGNDPRSEAIGFIGTGDGAANGSGQFIGFIQGLYLMTNFVCTQTVASNIHYYRTNFLTPGAL